METVPYRQNLVTVDQSDCNIKQGKKSTAVSMLQCLCADPVGTSVYQFVHVRAFQLSRGRCSFPINNVTCVHDVSACFLLCLPMQNIFQQCHHPTVNTRK